MKKHMRTHLLIKPRGKDGRFLKSIPREVHPGEVHPGEVHELTLSDVDDLIEQDYKHYTKIAQNEEKSCPTKSMTE